LEEKMGLLISVPGASLSVGLAVSLLTAFGVCGVSPVQLIPQESARLPLQSTGLQNFMWSVTIVLFRNWIGKSVCYHTDWSEKPKKPPIWRFSSFIQKTSYRQCRLTGIFHIVSAIF